MAFTPTAFTDGVKTETAYTASDATQYRWDGWWALGEVETPLALHDRMKFGPTPPVNPRRGTVYISTPV